MLSHSNRQTEMFFLSQLCLLVRIHEYGPKNCTTAFANCFYFSENVGLNFFLFDYVFFGLSFFLFGASVLLVENNRSNDQFSTECWLSRTAPVFIVAAYVTMRI